MIIVIGILTLLVATSTDAQSIKGGRIKGGGGLARFSRFQQPAVVQEPHIHVGKGGGGAAVHHTAVVQDPISGSPVVVEEVSPIGSGIKGAGIKTAGLGGGAFGRRLYRVGQSQIPFGLLGSDYYSYPTSLLTAPRALRRKTVLSDNLSGLAPVGFGARTKGSVIVADPSTSQFTVGDAQIKTGLFGARPVYRSGISSVPYGLMGLDYYSYPKQLLTQRLLSDDLGLGQTHILTGGSAFTAGDSQIRGALVDNIGQEKVTVVETDPLGGAQRVTTIEKAASPLGTISLGAPSVKTTQQVIPEQVAVVEDGFGQRQVIKTSGGGLAGLRGGQIIFSGARGLGLRRIKTRPVVSAAPVVVASTGGFGQQQIFTAAAPQVLSQVKTDVGLGRSLFGNRVPQLIYVDGGRRFPGVDIIGGYRIGDPRLGYTRLPISTSRFANLGLSQASIEAGPTLLAPASPVIGLTKGGLLGKTSPAKVVTQEEVIGPAGDRQIVTTVTKASPQVGPSKIGGAVVSGPLGLAAVGAAPTKVITQEEVVGPAGDPQVITTITETDSNSLLPSKIGGLARGGLAGVGKTSPAKVVTQEEVVGPLGSRQVVTTVTETQSNRLIDSKIGGLASGGLAAIGHAPAAIVQQEEVISPITGLSTTSHISQVVQDPIETAIQETLGVSPVSQTVQSLIDPLSGGQTQVAVDDVLAQSPISTGGVTQVRETLAEDPLTGEISKVTEVTKSGGGGILSQQNVADAIVQESISSGGLGGLNALRYLSPRVSFLSQYPYDAPDAGLLRSIVTRPVIQQQQELEQILV